MRLLLRLKGPHLTTDRHARQISLPNTPDPMANRSGSSTEDLVLAIAAGLGGGYAVAFTAMYTAHVWLFDAAGHPDPLDFVAYWSAGRLALNGAALAAYSPQAQYAAEVATVGHSFRDVLGWTYPPSFFLVMAPLAALPFTAACVVWNLATLVMQGGAIASITRKPVTAVAAAAAPWVMLDMLGGQNGLFTAALLGAFLINLERRPMVSGVLLGLLAYKPQLCVLIPLVLAADSRWRVLAWAAASALAVTGLSCALFGFETLPAFIGSIGHAAQTHLITNTVGAWSGGLQSAYGLGRWLGAPSQIAWLLQAGVSLWVAVWLLRMWRSTAAFEIKAAALAAALPLFTPYVFVYDLPVLSVAIAFLYRQKSFDWFECAALTVALISVAAFAVHPYPAGLIACGILASVALRRASRAEKASDLAATPIVQRCAQAAIT